MSNIPEDNDAAKPNGIKKPEPFNLDRFKWPQGPDTAGVETLQAGLPAHSLPAAKDYVRLHPDELNYWSCELCFADVPITGSRKDVLHLVDHTIAISYLPSGLLKRFRIALATKPNDAFFLCVIPTRNLDNSYNRDNVAACQLAKTKWVRATSLRETGTDGYLIDGAQHPDAFPAPRWPQQPLMDLIGAHFRGRMIDSESHPGLLRLLGRRQDMK